MKKIFIRSGELIIGPVILKKHEALERWTEVLCDGVSVTMIDFSKNRLQLIKTYGDSVYKLTKR